MFCSLAGMLAYLLYKMSLFLNRLCLFLQSSHPQPYLQMMTQSLARQVPALVQHYLCLAFQSINSVHLTSELNVEEEVLLERSKHNIITSLSTFLWVMQS